MFTCSFSSTSNSYATKKKLGQRQMLYDFNYSFILFLAFIVIVPKQFNFAFT